MGKIVRHTSEEVKKKPSLTDWAAVRNMTDEEIDAACERDPVWQEMGGEDWMDNAKLVRPSKKGIRESASRSPASYSMRPAQRMARSISRCWTMRHFTRRTR